MRATDRRKFARFTCQLHATYAVNGRGSAVRSLTRNIGPGGLSFFTATRIMVGTVLCLELQLSGRRRPIRCTAQVIWSGPLILEQRDSAIHAYETGVRLLDVAEDDQAALIGYASAQSLPPHELG